MFVVKRPFRNFGKVYTVGSVITEPTDIKRFKGRLAEGKIIEVKEQDLDAYAEYFKCKYDVDIQIDQRASGDLKAEELKAEELKAEKPKVASTAKPIVVVSTSKE